MLKWTFYAYQKRITLLE
ncbi:hypothetical protein Bhyg_01772 [Pseudolycoriella hygida]|uniref:Uncharacterized protein n=1 Tax=Pseudolycoriella hygida TaxID=35572 RepID=A0A9Q0NA97_9DIPT|nr:hypothetical protein Bhyg_01772 [Pseudolycoriella hygida]